MALISTFFLFNLKLISWEHYNNVLAYTYVTDVNQKINLILTSIERIKMNEMTLFSSFVDHSDMVWIYYDPHLSFLTAKSDLNPNVYLFLITMLFSNAIFKDDRLTLMRQSVSRLTSALSLTITTSIHQTSYTDSKHGFSCSWQLLIF